MIIKSSKFLWFLLLKCFCFDLRLFVLSHKLQESFEVTYKSHLQEFKFTRVIYKSLLQESFTRVLNKSQSRECHLKIKKSSSKRFYN